MKKIAFALAVLCVLSVDLRAQGSATFHVFPQMADGLIGTTNGYTSLVVATNTSASAAACTMRYYGAGLAGRYPSTFTLPATGSFTTLYSTTNNGVPNPLAIGYSTMTCTQPVVANVAYLYFDSQGKTLSGATVFSSPAATHAQLLLFSETRLGLALANDTDSVGHVQATLLNTSGQAIPGASKIIDVPARSNTAAFVDEIMGSSMPPKFDGAISLTSSGPFSVVGLIFSGNTFLSEPAAILP
jgi:hypothetical protein